ncbi:MAG: acylneuraminate cytidylyltransferase family protein [Flavobacteriaceae bacterium]|nr:acylneuraminate cytidylyltransferase family protein [Flavobacteriaceae bacterium]
MTNKRILAIIPARGGSKGIPDKNIIEVAGKPLITWTIEAALKSEFISKTIVSSDSDIILEMSKKYGTETIKRPANLASDSARSEPVMTHVLKQLKDENYDYVMLLQPTSPLRTSDDIDAAVKTLVNTDATALISVYKPQHHPLKAFKTDDKGFLKGLVSDEYPFTPRQKLPKTFYPNGAIYIVKTDVFLKTGKLFTAKTLPFEMSAEKSLDIDTKTDFEMLSKILAKTYK